MLENKADIQCPSVFFRDGNISVGNIMFLQFFLFSCNIICSFQYKTTI